VAEFHTVAQGEYLSMIAAEYGFRDYTIIWDHPNNAQLKDLRKNPNVLFPGDSLFIPDKEEKQEQGATSKRHTFQVKQEKLKLRLVLEDIYEKPIANAACVLFVEEERFQVTTDGSGKIEQEIPLNAQKGLLIITSDQTPFEHDFLPLKIGHLDPVDTVSGQRTRLNNLGYFAGDSDDPKDPAFLSAAEEFQCDYSLSVDGDVGPQTQARLKQVHGC
jgi:Putative peptidoglycan binding domain